MTLRVLTWNVLRRDLDSRVDLIASRLEEVDADIVMLQETGPKNAAELAARAGYQLSALSSPPIEPEGGSVAILTRHRATDVQAHALPVTGRWAAVDVTVGASTVRIASAHLRHTPDAGTMGVDADYRGVAQGREDLENVDNEHVRESVAIRLAQLDHLGAVFDGCPTPLIFGGDLNFVPNGPEYGEIIGWGLLDTWRAAPRLGSRATVLNSNPLVSGGPHVYDLIRDTTMPGARGGLDYVLDYQFASTDLGIEAAWTVGQPDDDGGPWPSDHLGVVVDYRLAT
ncbi:endonuclease/exonuclease/phosphatase family protein [Demetria terragena]|uniref:endonuclease/exonuclease/phosphatase family protein n=1 Tax=Demetria terragena TaxID=63959 RepID=UPI00037AA6F3|nr:endonuclease/exonuclease/phosphatase family protein [Demetria terragena]